MNQHQTATQHIELYLNKYRTTDTPEVKRDYLHKVMGMLSLARMLDIISSEEYEYYFKQLYV